MSFYHFVEARISWLATRGMDTTRERYLWDAMQSDAYRREADVFSHVADAMRDLSAYLNDGRPRQYAGDLQYAYQAWRYERRRENARQRKLSAEEQHNERAMARAQKQELELERRRLSHEYREANRLRRLGIVQAWRDNLLAQAELGQARIDAKAQMALERRAKRLGITVEELTKRRGNSVAGTQGGAGGAQSGAGGAQSGAGGAQSDDSDPSEKISSPFDPPA
jgi:hypothetical protein